MKGRGVEAALQRIYTVLVIAAVLCAIAIAKDICIPLALAALVTFVLAPLVTRLEQVVGRITSVMSVLCLLTALTGVAGWILSQQLVDFATRLPEYHAGVQRKVAAFQEATGGQYTRLSRSIEAIRMDLPGAAGVPPVVTSQTSKNPPPVTVTVIDRDAGVGGAVSSVAAPILNTFALTGLVLLLTVFMLLYREDVRGRILRLAGQGRISLATTAMAETRTRVFRYLVMQLCVNLGFGLAVAIGLYAIGIPNPPLWGALAAVLRFIPYVGPWIAACLPILLALAVADGWGPVLMTIGLFAVLELVTNNIMEPWLYGASTGVSSLALILAAVFWGWIWGPIGLILATPLTVCLVVMGRHVPRLNFLSVLLSDEEPLLPHEECYHRLLRSDLTEANALVERFLKTGSLTRLYDEVLIPVLISAEADYGIDDLDRERRNALHQGIRDLLDDRALHLGSLAPPVIPADEVRQGKDTPEPPRRVLCLPVRATRDELAAIMLAQALRERGCDAHERPSTGTASDLVAAVTQERPDAVCISVVAPSAIVHARNLCMKLHAQMPELPIVVGFWGQGTGAPATANDFSRWPQISVVTSLVDAVALLAGEPAMASTGTPERTPVEPAMQRAPVLASPRPA